MTSLKIVTTAISLLFFSHLYCQDHVFKISSIAYLSQIDDHRSQVDDERFFVVGAGLQVKHFVASIPVVGSRLEATFDSQSDATVSFTALVLRFDIFDKLMTVELLSPTFTYKFNKIFYSRPFGAGLEIGKKSCRVYITELMSTDFIFQTRLAIKYIF
jgi:hypothetical protein